MNFGKQKATDLRQNPRIYLPKPRPPKEEAFLEAKEHMYQQTWYNYQNQYCDQKGNQLESNLTPKVMRGVYKINKRQANGKFIVSNTDKSTHFTVSTPTSYEMQGEVHIGNDREITWNEYNEIHNKVLQNTKAISYSFQPGKDWGEDEEIRVRETLNQRVTTVAHMSLQQKDQKPTD